MIIPDSNSASSGYDIDNSVKLEANNGEKFISSQFGSAGNQKTWTISFWVKITELGTYQMYWGCFDTYQYKGTDDKMYINFRGASENFFLATNRVFRDTSAWYHFVVVCDATNGTAADRGRFYINGVRETDYQLSTYQNMDSNDNTYWNGTNVHSVGGQNGSSTFDVSGYMAEFHSVDGQALDSTDFGEFDSDTGIWKPKAYTGSYGTNGFYLDFENSSDLGDDVSGNSKAFTNTNITSVDQATDTPTNNFCLINTLQPADQTVFYGATIWSNTVSNSWRSSVANTGVNNGKWYYEITIDTGAYNMVGITGENGINTLLGTYLGASANATNASYGYLGNGVIYNNAGQPTTGLPTFGGGNIISIALDMDNGYVYFAKNGSWVNSGDPTSGSSGTGGWALYDSSETQFFASSIYGSNDSLKYNFGGFYYTTISTAETDSNGMGIFEYAPPSGYYALCSKNLAEFG